MKSPKAMTYKELETEVITINCEVRTASIEKKRELINRSHDLMVEMDRRWNNAELRVETKSKAKKVRGTRK